MKYYEIIRKNMKQHEVLWKIDFEVVGYMRVWTLKYEIKQNNMK